MKLGIETLIESSKLIDRLKDKKVALVAHPASTNQKLEHSLDLIASHKKINLVSAFGPQHGLRGEKQDNMIESDDYRDPVHQIPVFSLYGQVRKPTDEMMKTFDILLFDLQDVGCRVYTFLTTLFYLIEACSKHKKEIWILDRPNPAGRAIEGSILKPGWESFVGAGPIPMRHGLTLGELALWYRKKNQIDVELEVISLKGYRPTRPYDFGWPLGKFPWVNPSPNIPNLHTTRVYPGTVIIEGTHLSEGRGTTHPLSVVGAPNFQSKKIIQKMKKTEKKWLRGCYLRPCFFQPTFHKFQNELCEGIQIHVDDQNPNYFKPYRLIALMLKAFHEIHPDFQLWSDHPYEYETKKTPVDVITGGLLFRNWVEDPKSKPATLDTHLSEDEKSWKKEIRPYILYS